MDLWFTEEEDSSLRYSYKVNSILASEQSEFQKIDIVETEAYGRMLLLDGFVMLTEADEFVYHELIAHIPMCMHPDPKKVVVIGGGDGGTVRELVKHDCLEKVTLCEIDGKVVELSKEHFPGVASGLRDPRVTERIGDGIAYMKTLENEIDIAIIDSTDPIGPGEGLFTGEFYKSVAQALRPGGLMVAQSESPWQKAEVLKRIHRNIGTGFPHIRPYLGSIPTYPRGLWSWTMASHDPINPELFNRERFNNVNTGLQYLNEKGFLAAFALPSFYEKKLK